MTSASLTAELCLKCNICTAACPVAAATPLFPGPKAVGPQAQRFRHPLLPPPDASVTWCSGCGTCSRVCPHGVAVAEINIQAKASLAQHKGIPFRDQLISRPHWLGKLGSTFAFIANPLLSTRWARRLLAGMIGIHAQAPMPPFAATPFRQQAAHYLVNTPGEISTPLESTVAVFHGCSADFYEPSLGLLVLRVLQAFGKHPVVPPQTCCGLPMQSNGLFEASRHQAKRNLQALLPFASAGIPIIGTSTSCMLSLKHDYRNILGLEGDDWDMLADKTYDIFEYLALIRSSAAPSHPLLPIHKRALYHPPCQLRSHNIGIPALSILRDIPGLELELSEAECCGMAGTYGLKSEKFGVAKDVAQPLLLQIRDLRPDFIICDSETCRWWIAALSGLPVLHPLQVLAEGLGMDDAPIGGPSAREPAPQGRS
jgi:glycerol-3-phosphate dehydrogenase subunit C